MLYFQNISEERHLNQIRRCSGLGEGKRSIFLVFLGSLYLEIENAMKIYTDKIKTNLLILSYIGVS
jgi:hypothetical protein